MGVLASDTFARANASGGWGTASDGTDTWAVVVGSASAFSINTNEGQTTTTSLEGAYLGTGTAGDVEAVVRFQLSATGDAAFIFLRGTATNTQYRIKATGTLLTINRSVTGTITQLVSTAVSIPAATPYWLKARIVGSTLYAKVWADGSAEPAAWTLSKADASPINGAGKFGLAGQCNVSTGTVKFDSFTVNQAYNIQGQAQATFKTRVNLSTPTQARFQVRQLQSTSAQATFRITAAGLKDLVTSVRATFKINAIPVSVPFPPFTRRDGAMSATRRDGLFSSVTRRDGHFGFMRRRDGTLPSTKRRG